MKVIINGRQADCSKEDFIKYQYLKKQFETAKAAAGTETIPQQRRYLSRFCNSYERLPQLLKFYKLHRKEGTTEKWFSMLRYEWCMFDNVGQFEKKLKIIFKRHPEAWPLMMNTKETKQFRALADPVTLYRGAGLINRLGLSWTTSKQVAARFMNYKRYRQPDSVLLTGKFLRRQIVAIKNGRGEAEVIVLPTEQNILTAESFWERATRCEITER